MFSLAAAVTDRARFVAPGGEWETDRARYLGAQAATFDARADAEELAGNLAAARDTREMAKACRNSAALYDGSAFTEDDRRRQRESAEQWEHMERRRRRTVPGLRLRRLRAQLRRPVVRTVRARRSRQNTSRARARARSPGRLAGDDPPPRPPLARRPRAGS